MISHAARVMIYLSVFAIAGQMGLAFAEERPNNPVPQTPELASDPLQSVSAEQGAPVTYQIDFSVVVTAPYHTKKLKVWLPLPQSDLGQEISNRQLTSFPMRVEPLISRETVHGNEFAYFEFDHPEGAQIIRHQFQAVVRDLRWNLDPARVVTIEQWPERLLPYLKPSESLSENGAFRHTIDEIAARRNGAADELFAVLNWVDQNLKYDHVNASLKADAKFAFESRGGHCSDYHGLCSMMGRSLKQPTRVTYGINLFPKNSPSHCKLEAFLPPYGWVSFDVSETQRLVAAIQGDAKLTDIEKSDLSAAARRRLLGGFRDNTWLLMTKGTDYELAPKATSKVSVVRTIYAEADGVALPDPDPANPKQREFGWMTIHDYKSDRRVNYPFKDWTDLRRPTTGSQK